MIVMAECALKLIRSYFKMNIFIYTLKRNRHVNKSNTDSPG